MTGIIVQDYIKLTEFLGRALGPDFEVTLHDLSDMNRSVIAIANGHVSGRTIGSALGDAARQIVSDIRNGSRSSDSYRFNFSSASTINNHTLRSSLFFIKDEEGTLSGMLCINFDDARYRELSERILKLRPPSTSTGDVSFIYDKERSVATTVLPNASDGFQSSILSITEAAINQVMGRNGVPVDRLTLSEKMKIISILEEKGVFMLKGAVKLVAQRLSCSQASVYRYLNRVSGAKQPEAPDVTA